MRIHGLTWPFPFHPLSGLMMGIVEERRTGPKPQGIFWQQDSSLAIDTQAWVRAGGSIPHALSSNFQPFCIQAWRVQAGVIGSLTL